MLGSIINLAATIGLIFSGEACVKNVSYFFDQQEQLLKKIAENSQNREILTAKAIRIKVELAVKRSISDDYLWDLSSGMDGKRESHTQNILHKTLKTNKSLKNSLNS